MIFLSPRHKLALLALLSPLAFADPFYPDEEPAQQAVDSAEKIAKLSAKTTACSPTASRPVTLPTAFSSLKLVGIARFGEQFRAIFSDEQHRIVDLSIGDLVVSDQIEIQQISLKAVQYIDWQRSQNCEQPTVVTLKL